MSATRDQDQRFTFLYSNLYKLYREGKRAAQSASVSEPSEWKSPVRIEAFKPVGFIAKRIPKVQEVGFRTDVSQIHLTRAPSVDTTHAKPALESLHRNLKSLSELEARMKYMLDEIQDLLKKR